MQKILLKDKALSLTFLIFFIIPFIGLSLLNLLFYNKIFPGIYIAGISVKALTPEKASEKLINEILPPKKIILNSNGQDFEIPTENIGLTYKFLDSANNSYKVYRNGNFYSDQKGRVLSFLVKRNQELIYVIDENKLDSYLSVIAGQITTEPVSPSINLVGGKIIVDKGAPGEDINIDELKKSITENLKYAKTNQISIKIIKVENNLSQENLKLLENKANSLLGKNINLKIEYSSFNYKDKDLIPLLLIPYGFQKDRLESLISSLEKDVNREPQNSTFIFQEGQVKEFIPSKDGIRINSDELGKLILQSIDNLSNSNEKSLDIEIPATRITPNITMSDVNNLGIRELIGRGSSKFKGSITSRIHNIGLASSKFNSVLIAPGEIFSFNKTLGDVSSFTGYKQAYIIQDGKTVLGDGGGVCQVSTTLFRAVLNSGLEVVERKAHSYRVGYYEQDSPPGFDATVFDPVTDFKFKNNTVNHILLQTTFDPNKYSLVFEIYGTNDGRTSTITKPTVTGIVPPPEDLYTDDPTLPVGTIKQIDFKAWGAKVSFNYKVERDGEVLFEKTFISNYRPWQAKYLRGTGSL